MKDPNVEVRGADSRAIDSFRLTSQLTARNRVSFSHEHQHRCSGSSLTSERRRLPDARGRTGWRSGTLTTSPEIVSRLSRFPLQRHAGDLVVAGDEPPAARGGLFALPVPLGRIRHRAAGRLDEPDSGHRTVDDLRTGELQLSRAVRSRWRFAFADNDANPNNWRAIGFVRHRRPQHEGRLSGLLSEVAAGTGRQPDAVAVHVQQRRARNAFGYYIAPTVGAERSHRDRVAVRAGPVDDGPADAAGRAALRPRPGAWAPAEGNGTTAHLAVQPPADQLSRDGQRRAATTTSRRGWAPPTTSSATARRRSR